MPPFRSAAGFFGRFFLYFLLLMLPWPGLAEAYGAFYRAAGSFLFSSAGENGVVQIDPLDTAEHGRDMRLSLENTRTHTAVATDGRTRLMGYQPTAFVAALILATPLPWPRRWRAMASGMAGVTVYALLRLGVLLCVLFSGDDELALFHPGPIGRSVLGLAHWVLVTSFAGSFVLPLGIWFLATFRRGDWERLVGERSG